MELKEFIKGVLKDITEAVEESTSQRYLFSLVNTTEAGINFDLAIVLKEEANGKIGAEIFSTIGAKAEGSISQEKANRVQFKILPYPLVNTSNLER